MQILTLPATPRQHCRGGSRRFRRCHGTLLKCPRAPLSRKTRSRGPLVAQTSVRRLAQPCGADLPREPQTPANEAMLRSSSSGVVVPDSACHAGGRGFESRRYRRKRPANRLFCCRFWRSRPPASQPVTPSSRTRISDAALRVNPCKSLSSVARQGSESSVIPRASRKRIGRRRRLAALLGRVGLAGEASRSSFR